MQLRSRYFKLFSVLLALSPGCLFLSSSPSHAKPNESLAPTYKASNSAVEMSFEYVRNLIVVNASSPNNPDLSLILDTGSNYCILDSHLSLSGKTESEVSVNTSLSQTRMTRFQLDNLVLKGGSDEISASSLPVLRTDLGKVKSLMNRRIDGILGLSFLAGYIFEIDYQEKKIRFWTADNSLFATKKDDRDTRFRFNLNEERPGLRYPILTMDGMLQGVFAYPFVVDTGFGGNLSVTSFIANKSGLLKTGTPQESSTTHTVTGGNACSRVSASNLKLGGMKLEKQTVQVDFCDEKIGARPGLIGNLLLQNYVVTFDYSHRQLLLREKNEDRTESSKAECKAVEK